jgi:hypothetical protein
MPTDTSERGLEGLIADAFITGAGYVPGVPKDYDRDYAVDFARLHAFLQGTQPSCSSNLATTPRSRSALRTRSSVRLTPRRLRRADFRAMQPSTEVPNG